jgi:hypothetical protein
VAQQAVEIKSVVDDVSITGQVSVPQSVKSDAYNLGFKTQKWLDSAMPKRLNLGSQKWTMIIVILFVCISQLSTLTNIFGGGVEGAFRATQTGKALYSCVSSGGSLNVKPRKLDNGGNIEVVLIKDDRKKVTMQFAVDEKLQQAKLVGVEIEGESKTSKFSLMLQLEILCGGELASKMIPDTYNALQLMQRFR